MRFGIGVALFLSISMVLGAGYLRAQGPKPLAAVVSVSNPIDTLPAASTTEGYIATSTPEAKPESLTTTDLVARQLLLDYLGLASAGQTDDNSLQSLANKYVDQISSLSKPVKEFGVENLSTVPDTAENYLAYDKTLSALNQTFNNTLRKVDKNKPTEAILILAAAYTSEASQMKKMSVPKSAAQLHAKIIGNYETLASAYSGVNGDVDPSTGFANLYQLKDAGDASDSLWQELASVINSHE